MITKILRHSTSENFGQNNSLSPKYINSEQMNLFSLKRNSIADVADDKPILNEHDANLLNLTSKNNEKQKKNISSSKRLHRHRSALGSDGDAQTVIIKRKRSKHLNCGINAPPRHVHLNDWRAMVNLTENLAVYKSEGDLINPVILYNTPNQTMEGTNSLGSLRSALKNHDFNNDQQMDVIKHEKIERFMRSRCVSGNSTIQRDWIEQTFCKRECAMFLPSSKDLNKCGCGRVKSSHLSMALIHLNANNERKKSAVEKWSIARHTMVMSTDAYGTIEFQGGPHPFKSQYLRLNFDTNPANIMQLFEHAWQMAPPKLIITVHGGITNFDLQSKLARVFRKGLLKAARTTGAWIFTSGINAGVVRHVAAAFEGAISSSKSRGKIITVGIAPWGLLRKREDLQGKNNVVSYHPHSFPPKGRFAVLNNRTSFFLLVDNGTIGRYGADIILRRRLESYIAEKQKIGSGGRSVPVVCVVLEGGTCTVRTVLDYVTRIPRVPVVVCDGSGRASDLLAFAHQYVLEDGNLPEGIRPQLLNLIKDVFSCDKANAQCLILDILACVRQKHMITIFRLGENQRQDVDYAILTALLKGQNLSPAEQLSLALAWNRVDIARSDIFVIGQDWPKAALHNAMMEALIHNRVDFVRLLLENGVCMYNFLTIGRLEELYNTDQGPPNTLYYIVRDVVKIRPNYHYKLIHIGMAIEKLMANGYRSHYTTSDFRQKYLIYRNKCKERRKKKLIQSGATDSYSISASDYKTLNSTNLTLLPLSTSGLQHYLNNDSVLPAISGSRALSNHILWRSAYRRENLIAPSVSSNLQQNKESEIDFVDDLMYADDERRRDFKYPFSDLLIWAVLTKRHEMALCMWQHGEEALAKALVACRLYKSLSKEAAEDYLEVEICEELKKYAEEFRVLSLELLDYCYRQDDAQTLQLLTYELVYWGYETCLSLAVIVNNKQFLAHPCCQILLADLWHGGLRIRSNSNLKVILGLLFPPSIFFLEFKSREELMLQPQTAAEHEQDINDSSSSSSSESSSSSSSSSSKMESDNESYTPRRYNLSSSNGVLSKKIGPDGEKINANLRKNSGNSVQSLNLAALFNNKKKRNLNNQTLPSNSNLSTKNFWKSSKNIDLEMNDCNNMESPLDVQASNQLSQHSAKRAIVISAANILSAVSSPITITSLSKNCPTSLQEINITTDSKNTYNSNQINTTENQNENDEKCNLFNFQENNTSKQSSSEKNGPSFIVGCEDDEDDVSVSKSIRSMLKTSSNYKGLLNCSMQENDKLRYQNKNEIISLQNQNSLKKNFSRFAEKRSILLSRGIPLPNTLSFTRKRQIKLRRKIYEFFVAPITTFWAWTLSFIIFLSALTYVLLIRTPNQPALIEWYLLMYVVTFGMETIRKFFMSEPKKLKEKINFFFGNYWNIITCLAIIGFLIGFFFRIYSNSLNIGRVILAVNSVFWSIKLLDYLSVHPRFGPYITMAAKMVMNMSSIVVMLIISLLAFGLARQSITYPNEDWHWLLLRNVFYKPYFMLYGEVYANEIDSCGDEAWNRRTQNQTITSSCVTGHWIPPVLMTAFLLIANILLISMLIAIFNNIFDQTNKISQQIWLFQRYRQVMEYESTPFLPPPFTPIYHIFMILKYLKYYNCCCLIPYSCFFHKSLFNFCCCAGKTKFSDKIFQKKGDDYESKSNLHLCQKLKPVCKNQDNVFSLFDFSLKLFLNKDQVEKLHDFEEECMEDMARNKEIERNRSNEERLFKTAERTDTIITKLNDLTSKEINLKTNVRELENRLEVMESKQTELLECVKQVSSILPSLAKSIQNLSTFSSNNQFQSQPLTKPLHFDNNFSNNDLHFSSNYLQSEPKLSGQMPILSQNQNSQNSTNNQKNKISRYFKTDETFQKNSNTIYQRQRTTTYTGSGTSCNNVTKVDNDQLRMFGSLVSLSNMDSSNNFCSSQRPKSDSIRRRRRHDEYTSITDAIDISNIVVTSSTFNVTTTIPRDVSKDEKNQNNKSSSESRQTQNIYTNKVLNIELALNHTEDDADVEDLEEYEEDARNYCDEGGENENFEYKNSKNTTSLTLLSYNSKKIINSLYNGNAEETNSNLNETVFSQTDIKNVLHSKSKEKKKDNNVEMQ